MKTMHFDSSAFKQDRPIEGYTNERSVEYWESKVAQLRTNGSEDIKKHLEMCYHELNQTKKKIFLDIACFFGH